jgi:hypothetical protein
MFQLETASKSLDELRRLSFAEMQPIERLKALSLGLPGYFQELMQLFQEHEKSMERLQRSTDYLQKERLKDETTSQRQTLMGIIEKIIEILKKDHSELIDSESLERKEGHEIRQELLGMKSFLQEKKIFIAELFHMDELRQLKIAVNYVCKLLDHLHKMHKIMTIEPDYMDKTRKVFPVLESIVKYANKFFAREAQAIGKMELDHERARKMLANAQ